MQEGTLTTTETYSYSVGSTRDSRELFIFSREHIRRREHNRRREHIRRRERLLQQGAIHIQEGALITKGSYSYSIDSKWAGGSAC